MTSLPTLTAGIFLTCLSCFLPAGAAPALPVAPPEVVANAPGTKPKPAPLLTTAKRTAYLAAFEQYVDRTYEEAGLMAAALPMSVYREALIGFYNLQQQGVISADCHTLSIVDFSLPSSQERLWVVDVAQEQLLHHTLVAHGKNTGEEYAQDFSNVAGSEMSSLGFYVTGPTYQGKHGLSLRLQGLDEGYNTNALNRSVVIHGANYVSQEFVSRHGRLGRSQGCPALPVAETPAIIRTIKDGSVLYVHGPAEAGYYSELLQLDDALLSFAQSQD